MTEREEAYAWFDWMGYDTRSVSLVRVAQDAWFESAKRAAARKRERLVPIVEEAIILGMAMIEPENQPPQWSVEEALLKLMELLKEVKDDE